MSSVDKNEVHPRKFPQLIASQTATIGVFAAGLVYGWTSSAGEDGSNLRYNFAIDGVHFSWITSVANIGSSAMCVPTAILSDFIGPRSVMLMMTVPFTIGWACVIWPNSITNLIVGRLILGASAGAFIVAAPTYASEIADKKTRGKLNSYPPFSFYAGILVAYVLGLLRNMFLQSLISAAVSLAFPAIFFNMPESPTYSLTKGNVDAARKALVWLRGAQYDVESELREKTDGLAEAERCKGSFFVAFRSRPARKILFISCCLTFFQSFSGSDPILVYNSSIFTDATGSDGSWSAIIVSVILLVTTFLVSFAIDQWGRRLLLLISGSAMSLSTLTLGAYFYLKNNGTSMQHFTWVPLVGISCFLVFFSLGFAAIPWIISELVSPQIKVSVTCITYTLNWFLTFLSVKMFTQTEDQIGMHGVFWSYSAIVTLGVVFVYFALPETKNKSLEQIQIELRDKSECDDESNGTNL